jgi:hypothetical protein
MDAGAASGGVAVFFLIAWSRQEKSWPSLEVVGDLHG